MIYLPLERHLAILARHFLVTVQFCCDSMIEGPIVMLVLLVFHTSSPFGQESTCDNFAFIKASHAADVLVYAIVQIHCAYIIDGYFN